jgi:hypothetical protein
MLLGYIPSNTNKKSAAKSRSNPIFKQYGMCKLKDAQQISNIFMI